MVVAVSDIIKFFSDLDRLKVLATEQDPDVKSILTIIQRMECPEIIEYENFGKDLKETAQARAVDTKHFVITEPISRLF